LGNPLENALVPLGTMATLGTRTTRLEKQMELMINHINVMKEAMIAMAHELK